MSFDFSLLAQISRDVRPLDANVGDKRHGPSEETIDRVFKSLYPKKAQLVIDIAKKIKRSQSNTGWCLTILKARGKAYYLDKLGPRGAKLWIRSEN